MCILIRVLSCVHSYTEATGESPVATRIFIFIYVYSYIYIFIHVCISRVNPNLLFLTCTAVWTLWACPPPRLGLRPQSALWSRPYGTNYRNLASTRSQAAHRSRRRSMRTCSLALALPLPAAMWGRRHRSHLAPQASTSSLAADHRWRRRSIRTCSLAIARPPPVDHQHRARRNLTSMHFLAADRTIPFRLQTCSLAAAHLLSTALWGPLHQTDLAG